MMCWPGGSKRRASRREEKAIMSGREPEALTLEGLLAELPDDFSFFGDRYASEIAPALTAREGERLAAIGTRNRFRLGAVAGLALAGVSLAFAPPLVVMLALAGAAGLLAWGEATLEPIRRQTKTLLVEPVSRQFGLGFETDPTRPAEIDLCRELGLTPSYDRAKFEDRLSGERGGAPFVLFEAHLEERRTTTDSKGRTTTTWVTVFRGQCLKVRFPKPFSGVTRVYRDAGLFNGFLSIGRGNERVRLEDPEFEKAFQVFSTDQIEARFILTPDFMERLLGLESAFGGRSLRCAFSGGDMVLAVEGRRLFEAGSMSKPLNDLNRIRTILQDFAAVFLLIDAVSRRAGATPSSRAT
jgi:hypothetical protein